MKNFRGKTLHKEDGFTLIEILVVILIVGILAAIAIPVFLNQRKKANDAAVQSDLRNAVTTVEAAVNKTGVYPANLAPLPVSSQGVILKYSSNGQSYCIKGTHENGTASWYYDSVLDGISTNSCGASVEASTTYYRGTGGDANIYAGAGTWTANGTGPSGDVIMKLEHTPGAARGWGLYGEYNIAGLNIPTGAKVKLTYLARADSNKSYETQVANDTATQIAANISNTLATPTSWKRVSQEFTTKTSWVSGTHYLRFSLGSALERLEITDVQVEVINTP